MYEITQCGTSPEGNPVYAFGYVSYNGPPIHVTATLTAAHDTDPLCEWGVELGTIPPLSWDEARKMVILSEDLIRTFRRNEQTVLRALFPSLNEEACADLACMSFGDSKHTSQNPFVNAGIAVAHRADWKNGIDGNWYTMKLLGRVHTHVDVTNLPVLTDVVEEVQRPDEKDIKDRARLLGYGSNA